LFTFVENKTDDMKAKALLIFLLAVSQVYVVGQTRLISGKVVDIKNNPVPYANVYLANSMEGTSSAENGQFKFETSKDGIVKLIVSMMGYESFYLEDDVSKMHDLIIILKENSLDLDEVVIRAGNFILRVLHQ